MSKIIQDYLGDNVWIEDGFLNIDIYDLLDIVSLNTEHLPADNNATGIIALIIKALSITTALALDENGFTVTDNTQGIVTDTRLSRASIVTKEEVKQVQHKFVFNVFTKSSIEFTPLDVVGSIAPDEEVTEQRETPA